MTNKTKLSAAALFSALVLGGSFVGSTVFAADTPQAGPDPTKDGSVSEVGHAYVTFTKNEKTPIHDPSNPGKDITPSNPSDTTGETGELTLDAIPSQLNFGTQESTGAGQKVNLLASNDSSRPVSQGDDKKTSDYTVNGDQVIFTQVTNVATTNPSWSLSATMGEFTATTGGATLPGAFITFGGGTNVLDKYDATSDTDAWVSGTDALETGVKLTAGTGSAQFVTSKQTGTLQQQWKVKDVTLTTPQAPAKGDYTADINWTLTAAPDTGTTTQDKTPDTTTNPGGGS
ncbi:WxL domain-containing protein [Lacticaseibacillus sp. N501-2]|uniref:WxL domain-containing protein n=1 Tax=Lacticaseibacillus salsurae TaxID=3367729 RepID=UPI0038B3F0C2